MILNIYGIAVQTQEKGYYSLTTLRLLQYNFYISFDVLSFSF